MKQLSLKLQKKAQRPVVKLVDFYGIDAMLDSGALFPVWVEDEELLLDMGGKVVLDEVEFGGFGGSAKGRLYKIPYLKIGELTYPGFHIIACKMSLPCQMLMSSTMFTKLIYEVDDYNRRLNITIPDTESTVRNLVIWDSEGHLHVACNSEK